MSYINSLLGALRGGEYSPAQMAALIKVSAHELHKRVQKRLGPPTQFDSAELIALRADLEKLVLLADSVDDDITKIMERPH